MIRRIAVLLLAAAIVFPFAATAEPVDVELVLASDGSGSIDDVELRLQREGYAAAITHPRVLNAIQGGFLQSIAVAFVEWGGPYSQHTIVDWMKIDGPVSAAAFAAKLRSAPRQAESYNSISEAIAYSTDLILSNQFEGTRKIIDVSGDGPQIGGRPLFDLKARAIANGITINALLVAPPEGSLPGMSGEELEAHYRNDVIGGRGAFAAVARGRKEFADTILRKMILEIADAGGALDRFGPTFDRLGTTASH